MEPSLWETVEHRRLMGPISVTVQLCCGTRGPDYDLWKKRLALYLSLLRLRMREQDARLLIEACDGGHADIKQRADLLEWLVAQREVAEVTCEQRRHAGDGPPFSISVRADAAGHPAAAAGPGPRRGGPGHWRMSSRRCEFAPPGRGSAA